MSIYEAAEYIKQRYSKYFIWEGWEMPEAFYFAADEKGYYEPGSETVETIILYKENLTIDRWGWLGFNYKILSRKPWEYQQAFEQAERNSIPIDLTTEEFDELTEWREKFSEDGQE